MRMSSLVASTLLQREGVEAICQMACRDRNRIALQADLMGAHALGLRNILALTGDPVKAGDHKDAKSVFDLESVRFFEADSAAQPGRRQQWQAPYGWPARSVFRCGGRSSISQLVGVTAAI